ncbi:hypothetical protein [Promicromonospora iranensis]|jgi:hypothetical protein|uniref:hypothetical protein n=1 Tax=Promicromonospora iranensis TaxID=1105144 RepID=UPI0023A914DB|nr:hypothetical protein [Promicromonospora iranensis]
MAILEYVIRAAMQSIEPRETAALILHGAFPHDTRFVARFVGCSEGDLPGLLASARARLRRDRATTVTEPIRALRRLRSAWLEGDRGAVAELLSSDVEIFTDGGPDSRRLRIPVHGSWEVAALLNDIVGDDPPALELTFVDRVPWLIGRYDQLTVGFLAAEVLKESVRQVWLVAGPDTLGR